MNKVRLGSSETVALSILSILLLTSSCFSTSIGLSEDLSVVHGGLYSSHSVVTCVNPPVQNVSYKGAYVYKTFSNPSSTVYVRLFVKFALLPPVNSTPPMAFGAPGTRIIGSYGSGGELARLYLINDNYDHIRKWRTWTFEPSTGKWLGTAAPYPMMPNVWYCVEYKYVNDAVNGEYRFWINGEEILAVTGKNTASFGNLNRVEVGVRISDWYNSEVYVDDVVVSDSYIGPFADPASYIFKSGFETGDYSEWSGITYDDGNTIQIVSQTANDNTPPIADAGVNLTDYKGSIVTLNGSGSFDNVGIANYVWSFTDSIPRKLAGVAPKYTFETPRTYLVTLNVTDAAGNWATDEITVIILDETKPIPDETRPIAEAGPIVETVQGSQVSFDASNSWDNTGITSCEWSFGDGTTEGGLKVTHVYQDPGTYTVALIVRDAAGNEGSDTTTVKVLSSLEPFYWWIIEGIVVAGITFSSILYLFFSRKRLKT